MRYPPFVLVIYVFVAALQTVANVRPVNAQSPDPQARLTVEHWLDWERVSDPRISPDGARVVYTRG